MGELISIDAHRDRMVEHIVDDIGTLYVKAGDVVKEFCDVLTADPQRAARELGKYISKAREVNPEPAYESLAGGPNYDWTCPVINVIGNVYQLLDRDTRTIALKQCMDFLSGLSYEYSRDQVEHISEPWLVADIMITQIRYWPGFKRTSNLLEQHKDWASFSAHMHEVRSDFWRAYPIIQHKHSSLDVRKGFYDSSPNLLDRTLDGAAAMVAEGSEVKRRESGRSFDDEMAEYLTRFDPLLHERIREKIGERKWIRLSSWRH